MRPHEHREQGYSVEEYRVYCEGYYKALQVTLKVLRLAAERFALRRRERRAESKAARRKAGAA